MKHLKRFNEEFVFKNLPLEWPWKKEPTETIECPCCDGQGHFTYSGYENGDQMCPVCVGEGEVSTNNREYKKYIRNPFSYKEKNHLPGA